MFDYLFLPIIELTDQLFSPPSLFLVPSAGLSRRTCESPAEKAKDEIGKCEVLHKIMLMRKTRWLFRSGGLAG